MVYNESMYADPYQPISLTELNVLVIRGMALKLLVEEYEDGNITHCGYDGLVEHDHEPNQGKPKKNSM